MSFINHVKIVTMIVFKFCTRTERNKLPFSRFPAIAWLCSQSGSIAQVLILSAKSVEGCRGVEWIVNLWLAKIVLVLTIFI